MTDSGAGGSPRSGVASALGAAALFGASTPFAKLLLDDVSPLALAAALYLGSGLGHAAWIVVRNRLPGRLAIHREQSDDADAAIRRGIVSPVLVVGRAGGVRLDASEGGALVCKRVTHPRQCQCQIKTIGSLRTRTTPPISAIALDRVSRKV